MDRNPDYFSAETITKLKDAKESGEIQPKNVVLYGFGRIGRCTFRTSLTHPDVEVAAVNSRTIGPIMADTGWSSFTFPCWSAFRGPPRGARGG